MVTGHAGLAVRTSGEVAALFAHTAVYTRAVAVTLARWGRNRERSRRGRHGLLFLTNQRSGDKRLYPAFVSGSHNRFDRASKLQGFHSRPIEFNVNVIDVVIVSREKAAAPSELSNSLCLPRHWLQFNYYLFNLPVCLSPIVENTDSTTNEKGRLQISDFSFF